MSKFFLWKSLQPIRKSAMEQRGNTSSGAASMNRTQDVIASALAAVAASREAREAAERRRRETFSRIDIARKPQYEPKQLLLKLH
ncbi:hypothetical protein [Rhizobium rhizosphaerae]|uniref:hypothetical protein n=1 Tax=Xaviernesmea rhizosphaerae TaxID=1672749 RepID=UPI001118106B|nr:hypothetical protein [Xaviernesmea rhizosphaerae]